MKSQVEADILDIMTKKAKTTKNKAAPKSAKNDNAVPEGIKKHIPLIVYSSITGLLLIVIGIICTFAFLHQDPTILEPVPATALVVYIFLIAGAKAILSKFGFTPPIVYDPENSDTPADTPFHDINGDLLPGARAGLLFGWRDK